MSPVYVFLAFVVGMIAAIMLIFYLLAYIAGRYEDRHARKNADGQPDDAPLPST